MIASIDLTTSPLISLVCESACSASVRTARSTASLRFVGLRLEFFPQQRVEFGGLDGADRRLLRPAGISDQP